MKENKTITIPYEGIYEGDVENGKRHGNGKMSYKNVNSYDGEWDEFVRQLLLFRNGLEEEKGQKANELGLNET